MLPDGTKKTALNKGDKIHFDYTFSIYEATEDNVTEKEVDGIKKTYIKLPDGTEIEGKIGDKVILPEAGLKISSETVVKHGLSHQTFYSDMGKYLDKLFNVTVNGAVGDIIDKVMGNDPESNIK